MGLHAGGLIIGRIFASEILGADFRDGSFLWVQLTNGRWEAIVWRSLKQNIALCSYAQMSNAQLPKQPLLN